ncbi:hypothetical protein AB4156_12375 [Cupriavidus sp. 2MCAB6]
MTGPKAECITARQNYTPIAASRPARAMALRHGCRRSPGAPALSPG